MTTKYEFERRERNAGEQDEKAWQEATTSLQHPVGIFMAEHQIILQNLTELAEIVYQVGKAKSYAELKPQTLRLKEISTLLLETESHHQREEQVLFPRLEKRGITGPPQVMRAEHVELRARKHRLADLLQAIDSTPFPEFVKGVQEAGGYLAGTLRAHIYKEDNILYPTALRFLSPAEWQEVITEFAAIGYCNFTPGR